MHTRAISIVIASLLFGSLAFSTYARATTITFEGVAPSGGVRNVSPATPYTEAGFTFTPTNSASAVFSSTDVIKFPGDSTDWFGFSSTNTITMAAASPFLLDALLLGPSTIAIGPATMTLVGHQFGGGILNATFSNLTTATFETLNWSDLTNVQFSATMDSAFDNVTVNAVPVTAAAEPTSLALLGSGFIGLAARRRRNRR